MVDRRQPPPTTDPHPGAEAATATEAREGPATVSRQLRALQALNTKLICMNSEAANYGEIVRGVRKVVGCDTCAIFRYEPHREALVLKAADGYDTDPQGCELPLHEDQRLHCQAFKEEYLVHVRDCQATPGVVCLDDELRSNLVIPVISNQGPIGVFDFGSYSVDAFGPEDLDVCGMLVDQMAYSLENLRLLGELSESRDAVIRGMALLAESRDKNIGGHLDRICASSRLLAERLLGLPEFQDEVTEEFVETIARAAALHDIGKVGIADLILLKPGRLTDAEFEVMKTHTSLGHELLNHLMDQHGSYYMIRMGAEVALAHHEWWNGGGYPNGWRGEQIPVAARIVALADVYDALTSRRIYKHAWEQDEALDVIRGKAGTQFDPRLAELFLARPDDLIEIRLSYPD
jgi:HD-GYP domain-containing protein (c-di-GMP phosphodiesterase class II)